MTKIVIASDLIKKAELQAEADSYRESFPKFAKRAWQEVDTSKFKSTKFHELLMSELHDWGAGDDPKKRMMMLGVPPREGKTKLANIILPAWMWARDPGESILAYGSTEPLVLESNRQMRRLIQSDWYQERFCVGWNLDKAQHEKRQFATTVGGQRKAIGGGGSPTGWGGNIIIIDDPIDLNPRKPPPRIEDQDRAADAVRYLLDTRVNDESKLRALMIMQRSHSRDPMGQLLESEGDRWYKVFFDSICDPRMPYRHPKDKRKEGEVLCPERGQTREKIERKRISLTSDRFSAQYQQMPSAAGGMIIHDNWLQRYDDANPPPDTSYTIISWDFPQKGSATSSWVVGSVWGVECPDDPFMRRFVLRDLVRAHLDYPGMKRAVERLSIRYPEADLTIVEDKAAGPHLITELSHKIPTIVPFLPDKFGDKEQRLKSVSPVFESGKVFIPASGDGEPEWLQEYLNEITRFPKYATDDQVDSTTQCMLACMHRLSDLMSQVGTASMQIFDLEW